MSRRETIDCAAIRYGTAVYSQPRPARHSHVIALHQRETGVAGSGEQGFLTSTGRFVNRLQAARIAYHSGQLRSAKTMLFTEDLW